MSASSQPPLMGPAHANTRNLAILRRLDVGNMNSSAAIGAQVARLNTRVGTATGSVRVSQPNALGREMGVIVAPETIAIAQIPAIAAEAAMKIAADPHAQLTRVQLVATEALILSSSRPCLAAVDDMIDFTDPMAKDWFDLLQFYQPAIRRVLSSVGRIDLDGVHRGSGFVVAEGVVITNRHVLELLADQDPAGTWTMHSGATIDFACAPDAAQPAKRFAFTGVVFAQDVSIGEVMNLAALDVALLTVEPRNAAGTTLPPPLPTLSAGLAGVGRQCFVAGFPGRPDRPVLADGVTFDREMADAIQTIFNLTYGVKRLAPCMIDDAPGFADMQPGDLTDSRKWAFTHDASTLAGSSGSGVFPFAPHGVADAPGALGLHMAGVQHAANFAHLLNATPLVTDANPSLTLLIDKP